MNNGDVVFKVEHVSKKYCKSLKSSMLYGASDIGRNLVGLTSHSEKLRKNEFWAVDDVSFELRKGEPLGLIGANGSGKSTLLKMLNGIFWPDEGRITVKGQVSSLIEVGAGFHPMLTGRENVYINGAILGMTKEKVDAKFDDIVEFAEIGDFIDAPVKSYSTGMFVRLGFAIAVHSEPDILLIDEVLAVGDINFQHRCLRYISDMLDRCAVVLVSHSPEIIRYICEKVLFLNNGKAEFFGPASEGVDKYIEHMVRQESLPTNRIIKEKTKYDSKVEIKSVEVFDKNHIAISEINVGEPIIIKGILTVNEILEKGIIGVSFYQDGIERVFTCHSSQDAIGQLYYLAEETCEFQVTIPRINIKAGKYTVLVFVSEKIEMSLHTHKIADGYLIVKNPSPELGLYNMDFQFQINQKRK